MPETIINQACIFYNVYGDDKAGRVPVLLIHGFPHTGEMDWAEIAPELAQEFKVYVPDCRGHGKSSNPSGTYSFRQMADDWAEFVKAMGYGQMNIIGHSNGGNVALVTAVEHPEITRTAIIQAANAHVTDYLRQREPIVLDPEYYLEHSPEDVAAMISEHGELHGKDYWRSLLTMAMMEIISEPNYSPADLARLKRPVFSIMGANDRVNAPDRQAQYIAENIPESELWIPDGVGHSVHQEIADEWLERVTNFLIRRG
jgi:pimeloyl-ACP methyl ester carboxylesterase